jgi:hypothetical protein
MPARVDDGQLRGRAPIWRGRWLLTGLVLPLLAIGSILSGRGGAQEAPRPLLLLISIDGLRPDYVTAADSYQAKIPHLRRFLKDGAFADGVEGVIPTVTYPSHTTLITGVWPATHRILATPTSRPPAREPGRLVLVHGRHPRADSLGCRPAGGDDDGQHPVAGERRRTRHLEHSRDLARERAR